MPQNSNVELINNESDYQLKGNLTYDSIGDLIHQKLVSDGFNANEIKISCNHLKRIDSAGIALFIQWQRECEKNNKQLQFIDLPNQAVSLLKANQLDDFFIIENNT